MGCWNETCMISNLPIMEGETVGAVLIAKTGNPVGTSYPDEEWTPISPVIMGEYDGYGSLNVFNVWKDKNLALTFTSRKLEESLLNEKGDFRFLLEGKKPLVETLGLLISSAKSDTLSVLFDQYIPYWEQKYQPVSVVYIKEALLSFIYEATNNEVAWEYKQLAGKELDSTRVFTRCHPLLKALHKQGVSVETTLRVENWLKEIRSQWKPTSGRGSQREVENPETVEFYQLMASMAQDAYDEYEYHFGKE